MTIISWIRPAAVFLCRVKLDPDPFLIFGDQCPYPRKNQTDPQPPLCAECQIIMYKSLALLARKGSFLKTFPLSRKSSVQARNKYCLIYTITHLTRSLKLPECSLLWCRCWPGLPPGPWHCFTTIFTWSHSIPWNSFRILTPSALCSRGLYNPRKWFLFLPPSPPPLIVLQTHYFLHFLNYNEKIICP